MLFGKSLRTTAIPFIFKGLHKMADAHLFLLTIGPVKEFIFQARRTHDLFAGSALLSKLCDVGIKQCKDVFSKEKVKDIITPDEHSPHKPNRFVAHLNTAGRTPQELRTAAATIATAIQQHFCTIATTKVRDLNTITGFKAQLEDFLQIEWVFAPFEERNNESYIEAYRKLFIELAAVKSAKPFDQTSFGNSIGEMGRKCIVDGKRNVKVYRRREGERLRVCPKDNLLRKLHMPEEEVLLLDPDEVQMKRTQDQKKSGDQIKVWHVQDGEGISAVTLTRRLYMGNSHRFPSTTAIALMKLLEESKSLVSFKALKEHVEGSDKFFSHSKDLLYYRENIDLIFDNYPSLGEKRKKAIALHEAWTKELKQKEIPATFTKYYGLIMFDGDHMGRWLSGDWLKEGTDLRKFHRRFTGVLPISHRASQIN